MATGHKVFGSLGRLIWAGEGANKLDVMRFHRAFAGNGRCNARPGSRESSGKKVA